MYSTGIAYFLWLFSFFGVFGFHRIYLGKIPSGILWMLTGGLFGLGSIYDFFTLPAQVRQANINWAYFNGTRRSANNGQHSGQWRNVNDGQSRIINEKESVEQTVLRLAKANDGIISASELALAANISIGEAKKALDVMVAKGYAELRVHESGALVYAIPDLMM